MNYTLYYLIHACKNQIRKLFRTWVAILLLVCLVVGVIFGLGAAALSSLFEDELPEEGYEETLPDEELPSESEPLDEAELFAIVELIAGGVLLAVLVMSALMADKSASSIFLMADVNLLFPAPLRPQSVLLFRLIMQAGTSFAATLYMIFQIPNLINLGLGAVPILGLLAAWFMLLIYSKLISVLLYTLAADHPFLKKWLRYGIYGLLALLGIGFWLFWQHRGGSAYEAAAAFFNAPLTRYIPIWGWMKALVLFSFTQSLVGILSSFAALLVGTVLTVLLIRTTKADYYEEAMARSEEMAARLQAQREKSPVKKRDKDRGDRFSRFELRRGCGATVYFHKALYNRFRFAHLHALTKTAETYLVAAIGVAALQILVLKTAFFPAVTLVLAGLAFFRSLGNPIAEDTDRESFYLVPDTAARKIFFSFLGGAVNSLLDLLPALLISALLLRAAPLDVLLCLLLVLSVGTYADGVGLFISLSLPSGISQMVRSLVQILFIYFGLAPVAVLIIVGFALNALPLFTLLAVLLNLVLTAVSLTVSPLFVENGRK
jgi:hypothetical protein